MGICTKVRDNLDFADVKRFSLFVFLGTLQIIRYRLRALFFYGINLTLPTVQPDVLFSRKKNYFTDLVDCVPSPYSNQG